MAEINVKYVAPKDIYPNPDNPRINSSAVASVKESIRLFGFKVPVVIDKKGMILAGHTRYRAALMLGLESIPCVEASDLNEDEAAAFSVAENRTSDFAFFDLPRLETFVADIPDDLISAFDIDALVSPTVEDMGVEEKTEQSEPEKRKGLEMAPFEKYQYVMVLCRTEFDYTNLLEMLSLEDKQKAYIAGTLKQGASYGRVIEYTDFMEKIRES